MSTSQAPSAANPAHPLPDGPNPDVLPFAGTIPDGSVAAVLYEANSGVVRLIAWPWTSLEGAKEPMELTPVLANNAVSCTSCVRPHSLYPGGNYTVLVTCPHFPDDSPFFPPNAAIDTILPDPLGREKRLLPPLGDVVVIRHTVVPSNVPDMRAALWSSPLQGINVADGPAVHDVVRRAVRELDGLPPQADPWRYFHNEEDVERLLGPDGRRLIPMHWGPVDSSF
ncbi:hypothetical protein C8F01DRAFT_1264862 [Mycena amicta]|nr:hypothetical protein C8F01DRAFT_1092974 [Mycena amicta]KAJ7049817.1 hypothetical protein C8F01DRAFT_1264862 [Mycena amicta]